MNTITRLIFSTAVVLVVSAIAVAAQEADLVKVDVVVTEPRDRKVIGLEKENFQLWEDSVAQEIVSMTPGRNAGEYVLAFKATNSTKDGKWRRLRISANPPKGRSVTFRVLATSGYYAPGPTN